MSQPRQCHVHVHLHACQLEAVTGVRYVLVNKSPKMRAAGFQNVGGDVVLALRGNQKPLNPNPPKRGGSGVGGAPGPGGGGGGFLAGVAAGPVFGAMLRLLRPASARAERQSLDKMGGQETACSLAKSSNIPTRGSGVGGVREKERG